MDESQGSAMSENLAKRIVIALGLGLVFGMMFDDSALGFAFGLALVFGTGLFSGKR